MSEVEGVSMKDEWENPLAMKNDDDSRNQERHQWLKGVPLEDVKASRGIPVDESMVRRSAPTTEPVNLDLLEAAQEQWRRFQQERANKRDEAKASVVQLEAENARLRAALEKISMDGDYCPASMAPGDAQDAREYAKWEMGEIARAALRR